MITSTTTPLRARRHRPDDWGGCSLSALLEGVGGGGGCRCCRGQCGGPVGVLTYRAVCAVGVDVAALSAPTPQGGMCCARQHRRRCRLVSRSTCRPETQGPPTKSARPQIKEHHHDERF